MTPPPSANGHASAPPDPEALWRLLEERMAARVDSSFAANALLQRSDVLRRLFDPGTDVDQECGFPKGWVDPAVLYDLYLTNSVAGRVCEVEARESWRSSPVVSETQDGATNTAFEAAVQGLSGQLMAWQGTGKFKDDKGRSSVVNAHLMNLDIVCGIGGYGIMVLGLDDGLDLAVPAAPREGQKLTFLREFPEALAQVSAWENDPASPRFGQPLTYLVTFNDARDGQFSGAGLAATTRTVHWTRVIHAVDHPLSSGVIGLPRMRQVLPHILSLNKIYGADGVAYWKGAFSTLSFETPPQGADAPVDVPGLRDQVEKWRTGLQREFFLRGLTAKVISPTVTDPTPHVNAHVEAICVKLAIPVPVFKGYEIGEQASTNNGEDWNARMTARQYGHNTCQVAVPFYERLIWLGVLPTPTAFYISWPALDTMSLTQKVAVGVQRLTGMSTYVQSGLGEILTPADMYTKFLYMTEQEAAELEANADEFVEEFGVPGQPSPEEIQTQEEARALGAAAGNPPEPDDDEEPAANAVPYTPHWFSRRTGLCVNCGGKGGRPGPCPVGGGPKRKPRPAPTPAAYAGTHAPTVGLDHVAPPHEFAASAKLAQAKIKNAPTPTPEKVAAAREELRKAREGLIRAGGYAGGSSADRKKQCYNLFKEFGGEERGYVVCPWSGVKLHWTTDPAHNPNGYPKLERGKIFVKCQGGGYNLPNLIPESKAANASRNDSRVRSENSEGC